MARIPLSDQGPWPIYDNIDAMFVETYAAIAALQAQIPSALTAGIPFFHTAKLTAAAAATPVHVLPAAEVPAGKAAYIDKVLLNVNGGTAWTDVSATIVKLVDTAGSPILGVTFAKAQLTGNAVLDLASSGVTCANLVLQGTGFTAAKGIDIVADAIFAAGSDIYVTVFGFIK